VRPFFIDIDDPQGSILVDSVHLCGVPCRLRRSRRSLGALGIVSHVITVQNPDTPLSISQYRARLVNERSQCLKWLSAVKRCLEWSEKTDHRPFTALPTVDFYIVSYNIDSEACIEKRYE